MTIAKKNKKYYAKKDTVPRIEKDCEAMHESILTFFDEMANSNKVYWERPWVLNAIKAMNGGKYMLTNETYEYKGNYNQWLIAYLAKDKGEMGPILINQGDIPKLFDVKTFKETPIVAQRSEEGQVTQEGIKSLGTFWAAPRTYWAKPDGKVWKPAKGAESKYPTSKEIKEQGLYKARGMGFSTYVAWSLEDVYPRLNEAMKSKADELMDMRLSKGYVFDESDDFHSLVRDRIVAVLENQNIAHTYGGNSAHYVPSRDSIALPHPEQFTNPLEWFSTTMHELAHSTMHINGRNPVVRRGQGTAYAEEEIVAETTAYLKVKELEDELQELILNRPEVKAHFTKFYSQSSEYVRGYQHTGNLSDIVETLREAHTEEKDKGKTSLIRGILTQIAKTSLTLDNVITKEQRLEAKETNSKNPKWQNYYHAVLVEEGKTPDTSESNSTP
jgi:hypothetical protein